MMVGNQGQCNALCYFGDPWILPDQDRVLLLRTPQTLTTAYKEIKITQTRKFLFAC